MFPQKRQSGCVSSSCHSLQIESLEARTLLSGVPIQVDTFADVSDPNDGHVSLREAIAQAQSDAGDNLINLPAGQYMLDQNLGQLNINDSSGKVTIQSAGATVDASNQDFRVLHIVDSDVRLDGLTITGGRSTTGFPFGGGILSEVSRLALKNSRVLSNIATEGGGIANIGGKLDVKNSVISANRSEGNGPRTGNGGGIANFNGELTIFNSEVSYNESHNAGNTRDFIVGGVGGGIISVGTPVFPGPAQHTVSVLNSSVSGNTVDGRGGGIMIFSRASAQGSLNVLNSDISNNSATDTLGTVGRDGGGILTDTIPDGTGAQNNVTLRNSRVSNNDSGNDGGGVWIGALDAIMLENSRVIGNTAGNDGGGIWTAGVLHVFNSWVFDNAADEEGDDIFYA